MRIDPIKLDILSAKSGPEILIYDEIGPDWAGMVSGAAVKRALKELAGEQSIAVRINSPGGDVFEGFAAYNALAEFPGTVNVHVDALAASAASVIAMAGKRIIMAANSMLMIHNCWVMASGNAEELRRVAYLCQKVDGQIIATYAARCRKSVEELNALLAAETWYTAEEAIAAGFADEVGLKTAVYGVVSERFGFKNTPEIFRAKPEEKKPETPYRIAASHRLTKLRGKLR